jgi:uncharacterized membrane protein YjgN (DUF898 family)
MDGNTHPNDLKMISGEIFRRTSEASNLFNRAQEAYEQYGNSEMAIRFLRQIQKEYPGTREDSYVNQYIERFKVKKERGINRNSAPKNILRLHFSGTGWEYFRVWIVNLCLTLVTLGIFSAWAKVRKKRYIYSHLSLDDTPFQYLASPIPILKGRIIAAVLFLLYYSSSHFFSALYPYVLAAGAIMAPWVFIRSISFNCRYSAYRNLSFRFNGRYLQAFKVLSAWGIIPVYLVGIFFQFWGAAWVAGILMFGFMLYYPWWMKNIKEFTVTHTSYGGHYGQFSATGGSFFKIYLVSGLLVLLFSLFSVIFIAVGVIPFSGNPYSLYLFSAPVYIGYIFAYAFIKANITNTVWKNIGIGPIFFECRFRTMDLVKLYLTNAVGIIVSAGLLIPWAVIRTFRYRVEHTQVFNSGPLTTFKGDQRKSVAAMGAELIDFFDLDVSL